MRDTRLRNHDRSVWRCLADDEQQVAVNARCGGCRSKRASNSRQIVQRLCLLLATGLGIPGCEPSGRTTASKTVSHSTVVDAPLRKSVFAELAHASNSKSPGVLRSSVARPKIAFVDVSIERGIEFMYQNGARGDQLMVEATGGGCSWFDYDRDGWPDLYLVQGGDPTKPESSGQPLDMLYRNREGIRFELVSPSAGIVERGYGQGASAADFDNDGFPDLLVTNVGQSRLFRNQGDGTFRDVTESVPLPDKLWCTSAAWGDVDRDGDLDLYVCRYCQYDPQHPQQCGSPGAPGICHPSKVNPEPDEFYLNLGDGRFRTCALELGLYGEGNRGLGVVIADFNNDRWPDIFVANDTTPNFLFVNNHGQNFSEQAMLLGCAVNAEGLPQANMGIACGDYDRNGWLDLYVTHFTNESNTLYANLGPQGFSDQTALTNLVITTLPMLAFGTTMCDFNSDGWQELFVANGHIDSRRQAGTGYEQPPQLFSFNGSMFEEIGTDAGSFFERRQVGRGVACADMDRDGRIDLVVVPQNSPTAILHNVSEGSRGLRLDLVGRTSNRQAVGTRVTAMAGPFTQTVELVGGAGYCSSDEPVLSLGFGPGVDRVDLRIDWPSGLTQHLPNVAVPQRKLIIEPTSDDGLLPHQL